MSETTAEATTEPVADIADAGADALGDAGKQALDRMKAERNAAKAEAKAAADAANRLKAELDAARNAEQSDVAKLQSQLESLQARADADARARREAEIRAAATGKLADPSDALRLLDVDTLESPDAIASAIDSLIESKPYLSGQTPPRFGGTADAGPRGVSPESIGKPSQLTRDDLRSMTPTEIERARAEGRFDDLLGIRK